MFESIQPVGNAGIGGLKSVEVGVDAFSSLLPHQSCTQVVFTEPTNHVVLQEMHLGENRCLGVLRLWKFRPIEGHKLLDELV